MNKENIKITRTKQFAIAIILAFVSYNAFAEERILTVNSEPLYNKLLLASANSTHNENSQVRLKFDSYLTSLHCSPSQPLFAAGFINGQVSIHDMHSGKELRRLQAHSSNPVPVWFSGNGLVLATISRRDTARFWDVATGNELFNTEFMPRAYPVLYQSRYLILIGSDISVLDMKTGQLQLDHRGYGGSYLQGIADPKSSTLYLLSYNALDVFDIINNKSGLSLKRRHREKLHTYGNRFNWISLESTSKLLVLVSKTGSVITINTNTFVVKEIVSHLMKEIDSFGINQDGDFIISGKLIQKADISRADSRHRQHDVVYRGTLQEGVTHNFYLHTGYRAYACFRSTHESEALVGTMTNIVNTDINDEVQQ